ncbi:AraC family transcriptional regulator [Bacillus canaveralius]|uniref:AraC family transcriptional regulator n=1 Tax=Bacillus canaveralius TaxID=1403243 RepID=A0A2N5GKM9_9BACI|nr:MULTISPECIES: helix-turn-helix domain-containing protein [Bacillus]PLR81455.1 AraC family transcriptional regulator [Bacillus sp. V33-4]PLR82066.1 AraC family transcriptional regulator [Bacillus canaveralius]PLR98028.1 AraC family transcriptional regulator [Bacillus canaveralius]RSK54392.1 AraC family transcriptional regulator [Bacillus canaveralius]
MKTNVKLAGKYFFPSQPEIESNTQQYKEVKAKGHLCKDIALFYQFKTKKNEISSFSVIPDGCFDILFCCGSNKHSAVLWTSPLHRTTQHDFESECDYFGIRFLPEQKVFKLKNSMKELLGKKIPLLDVISLDSSIVEKIGAAKSFYERIVLFETFIKNSASSLNYSLNIVEYSIKKIYSSNGLINIDKLSNETGYSARHLRNKFEEYIGFSPKQFSEIVRFQNSLAMVLHTDNINLLDVVHENGYHDQAHFIKGFKKFAHLTPIQFKEVVSQYPYNKKF